MLERSVPAASCRSSASRVSPARLGPRGGAGHGEGGGRELLHHPVVQGAGDPAPLLDRGVDGALQQLLALALGALEPAEEPPHDRQQQHGEEQQAADRHPAEAAATARRTACRRRS